MTTTESNPVFSSQPTRTSSIVAALTALAVVGLLASGSIQRQILVVAVVGIVAFAAGGQWLDDHRTVGASLVAVGTLVMVWTVGYTLTQPRLFTHRLELLPAIGGLWVLAGTLFARGVRWRRALLDTAIGLLFVAVFVSGVLGGSSTPVLVVAAAGLFVAWDAGENAVSLGMQVGSAAATSTQRAELAHIGATTAVGCGAVVAVVGVWRLGVEGIPLVGLIALLVASIALALAAYQ